VSEKDPGNRIREVFAAVQKSAPPPFDAVWAAAELQLRKTRRRYTALGGIAAVLALVTISFWLLDEPKSGDEFLIADSLLNSTQWSAPSDALMPQHEFDIYRDVFFPMESTDLDEGSLL
jgi:hypothetical protein